MSAIAGIRKKKIDKILQGACDYYGVTMEELLATRKGNKASVWKWKRFLVVILYDHTDMDLAEIQLALGYKSYQGALHNFKKLNEELSPELNGYDKTKRCYNELLKHLDLCEKTTQGQ